MEFTKEFIEKHQLSEDQVKGITTFAGDHIANLKKGWDTTANDNAEKIITGAVSYVKEKTGVVLDREQGEKFGDFFNRITDTHFENKTSEIEQLKSDYETKLKEFKGGDALRSELDQAKQKLDTALQRYADYDEVKEKAGKYDEAAQSLSVLKLEVAFNGIKPSFPDTVNEYEADAKWNQFKKGVLDKYNIEIVDNEPIGIDKENKHRQVKLKDLLTKDEQLNELLQGRKQPGTGTQPIAKKVTIDGVPFPVPENATSADISKAVREYLAEQKIGTMHKDYSAKFQDYYNKIREGKKPAA